MKNAENIISGAQEVIIGCLADIIAHKSISALNPGRCSNPMLAPKEPEFSFRPLGFKLSNGYTLTVQLMRENAASNEPMHEVCLTRTDGGEYVFALTGRGCDDIDAIKETVSSVLANVPGGKLPVDCVIEKAAFAAPLCRYLLVKSNGPDVTQEVFYLYEDAAAAMREQFAVAAVAGKMLNENRAAQLKEYGGLDYQFMSMDSDGSYGIDRFRAFAGTTWWTIFCLPVEQTSGALTVGPYADAVGNRESDGAFVTKLLKQKEKNVPEKGTISTMLTLSPEHISGETAAMLNENGETGALPVSVYEKNVFGWYVYFSDVMLANNPVPDDLAACIQYAQSYGCDVICFDSYEPTISALPTYNWDECDRAPQLD